MGRWRWFGVALLVWSVVVSAAAAATPEQTGTAVAVDPLATAELSQITRTLVAGSDVSVGDTVVTGPAGQVQVVFPDETRLVIGPNSSLLVETYLLRDDGKVGQFAVDALSGSFRFVTGKSDKSAYEIRTATGTIGVRGTAFDFRVEPGVATTLVLLEGAVHLCNLQQQCTDLDRVCGVASMASDGVRVIGPKERARRNLRAQFPFVQSESGLTTAFHVDGAADCLPAAAAKTTPPPAKPAPPKARPPSPRTPVASTSPSTAGSGDEDGDDDGPSFHRPHHPHRPEMVCDSGSHAVERHGRIICLPNYAAFPRYDNGRGYNGYPSRRGRPTFTFGY